jgi:transposase
MANAAGRPVEPIVLSADERTHLERLFNRYRNLTERFFNKIKHYRSLATRYDERAENFLAGIKLASIPIWMRFNESMT